MKVEYSEITHYHSFMEYFGEQHTFQTFDDRGVNKKLIKQLHGTLKQHFTTLWRLNQKGAGVFFCVNQTNGEGRSTKHIEKVRALFIDLDGSPLPNFQELGLLPNIVVKTSPNKFHCYWLVEDCPLESFSLYQQALATRFNSDPKVKDLPRVMRVAGFFHNKHEKYPVKVSVMHGETPYTIENIKKYYNLKRPQRKVINYKPNLYQGKYTGTLRYGTSEGDRHGQLVKILIAIRLRGESYEYMKNEAMLFARGCTPPENENEVMFQVNDIWKRYNAKIERLSN